MQAAINDASVIVFVLGDTSYGSCCLDEVAAQVRPVTTYLPHSLESSWGFTRVVVAVALQRGCDGALRPRMRERTQQTPHHLRV